MALTTVKQGGIAADAVGTAALDQDAGFTLAGLNGSSTVASEGGAVNTSIQQGLVKIWLNFNMSGTPSVRDSLNHSSITDNGTGDFTLTRTNNMNNDDYSVAGMCSQNLSSNPANLSFGVPDNSSMNTFSTSATRTSCKFGSGSGMGDMPLGCFQVIGDLA